MSERSILFSAPMVLALLDGRKTQTRRTVKLPDARAWWMLGSFDRQKAVFCETTNPARGRVVRCPYGAPGDRLWVRETWATLTGNGVRTVYRADGEDPRTGPWTDEQRKANPMKWRPSIYMPRTLSRITLEITRVRVERLQDISAEDAEAEGVLSRGEAMVVEHDDPSLPWARDRFRTLWDTLNGKRAPWASNPWLWVLDFRRVQVTLGGQEDHHVTAPPP